MSNMREQSKQNWTGSGSIEHINAGSLQRIADATEKMASSYDSMRTSRDYFENLAISRWESIRKLERKNAALRGVITKLKKEAGNGN